MEMSNLHIGKMDLLVLGLSGGSFIKAREIGI